MADIDLLKKLAAEVKATVLEACAKIAESHRVSQPENEFQRGINRAASDIAAKIRELM